MTTFLPHRFRRAAALAGLLVAALVLAACGTSSGDAGNAAGPTTTIKLGYFKGGAFAAQVAQDQKYFADEGLDVQLVALQAGPQILQATALKQVDIGYGDVFAWASGITNGFDNVSMITPANNTLGWLYAAKDSGVRNAADLAGKIVGVTPTPFPAALVKNWLMNNGVDPATITLSTVAVGSQASALQSGGVAAVFSFDFVTNARLAAAGGSQIADLSTGLISDKAANAAYYANSDFLTAQPQAAEKFVRAIRKAATHYNGVDRTEKARLTGLVNGVDLTQLQSQLPGLLDNPTWTTLLDGPLDVPATQDYLELGVKYGAVPKTITIADHLYSTATAQTS